MEFFLDTADVDEIIEIASWGILDGVTTNPSLIKKSGRDFKTVVKDMGFVSLGLAKCCKIYGFCIVGPS